MTSMWGKKRGRVFKDTIGDYNSDNNFSYNNFLTPKNFYDECMKKGIMAVYFEFEKSDGNYVRFSMTQEYMKSLGASKINKLFDGIVGDAVKVKRARKTPSKAK